jgi:hypothetical protein
MAVTAPAFLTFLLHVTDPEDLDFTMHCKYIWMTLDKMAKKEHAGVFS